MAKRRVRRIVRCRFLVGLIVAGCLAFFYGYWTPFPYQPTVVAQARANHLSPYFVAAVIRVESRFRHDAVSQRGAVGLMQLIPSTAEWISLKTKTPLTTKLTDPSTSIRLGSWYLRYLLNTYHQNPILALAAYNGGPETVDEWLAHGVLSPHENGYSRIPYPETANFVRRVDEFERIYEVMYVWVSIGRHSSLGVVSLAKLMSEETKMKLGERLGVAEIARQEGWGGVPARQCGNLVREAIRMAEEELTRS